MPATQPLAESFCSSDSHMKYSFISGQDPEGAPKAHTGCDGSRRRERRMETGKWEQSGGGRGR